MKMLGGLILGCGLIAILLGIVFWVINVASVGEIIETMIDCLEEEPHIVMLFGLMAAVAGIMMLNEGI